jgi:hypothetical protein
MLGHHGQNGFAETIMGGNPMDVIDRRRRSPLGLSGSVGAVPQKKAAPEAIADEGNERDDLVRMRTALSDAGQPSPLQTRRPIQEGPDKKAPTKNATTPNTIANALTRFQSDMGLAVDGFARPDGPTARTLDNIRRRRRNLASQGRAPESETLDDRLSVFMQQREERARIAADPHAAMMASRTGRLHLLRLAGTTDAATTRPILERLMAERTAAQAKGPHAKGPPDDGSRPPSDPEPGDDAPKDPGNSPPDDGSRPLPGDDDDDKPKDPEEPKENPCADEERAAREAEQTVEGIQTEVKELEDHIARLREEIRELESEAARFEALADREDKKYKYPGEKPTKTFPGPPSKRNRMPGNSYLNLLRYVLQPTPLNLGENRDLANDYRAQIEIRREKLLIAESALKEAQTALSKALSDAREALKMLQQCRKKNGMG